MLELIKKYTGVTYDVKGLTESELQEIIYSLEDCGRRTYNVIDWKYSAPTDTLSRKLRKLLNDK